MYCFVYFQASEDLVLGTTEKHYQEALDEAKKIRGPSIINLQSQQTPNPYNRKGHKN